MIKTIIVLPDGTELSSGVGATNAIQSVTITASVNDANELSLGSACANMVEAKLITPNGGLHIAAGDEIAVYRADETGTRHKIGLFTMEKPTRPSANAYSITAYDRVSWLDKDLTQWLAGLAGWPYSLFTLADMVCSACGLELVDKEIPNGDYPVQKFSADGITGNHLLTASTAETLRPIAQTLYEQLKDVSYRPCKVSVPASMDIRAGDIVKITDRNGLSFSAYVMTKITSGQKDTLECTGSHHRASTTAVNNQSYKALSGKVLNMRTDVEGLKVENADTKGNLARFDLNLQSISTRVAASEAENENLNGRLTTVEQTASDLTVSITTIGTDLENKADKAAVQEITEHFIFAEDGMTIKNSATGMGIGVSEQRVIFTGGNDPTTEIYPDRMETTDLKIGKQLDIGPFSWIPRANGNLSLRYVGKGQ